MIDLIKIEPSKAKNKKFTAIFSIDGKTKKTNFGAKGASDFTIHKDKERRDRYISRHAKDLKTNDPTRAGYLSMFILWNKTSLKSSIDDYKQRLKKNNWSLPNQK